MPTISHSVFSESVVEYDWKAAENAPSARHLSPLATAIADDTVEVPSCNHDAHIGVRYACAGRA